MKTSKINIQVENESNLLRLYHNQNFQKNIDQQLSYLILSENFSDFVSLFNTHKNYRADKLEWFLSFAKLSIENNSVNSLDYIIKHFKLENTSSIYDLWSYTTEINNDYLFNYFYYQIKLNPFNFGHRILFDIYESKNKSWFELILSDHRIDLSDWNNLFIRQFVQKIDSSQYSLDILEMILKTKQVDFSVCNGFVFSQLEKLNNKAALSLVKK